MIEWLGAEAATGRACELAVLHRRRHARVAPPGLGVFERRDESPAEFVPGLAQRCRGARAPVSTHLVGDQLLALLWQAGVCTVPVVHNAAQGWRSDPRLWPLQHVPQAVACAGLVGEQMRAHGCRVPVLTLRHRPRVRALAFDLGQRQRIRAELGIAPESFLVLAAGAIKPQKDYARAIEVLRHLAPRRDVVLVNAGGVLDDAGLAELDHVMDAACAAGVSERLRLPGFVDPIKPYYAAADVLLNVSRYEGLSMAVREALAAGLPVEACDVGGQGVISDAGLTLLPHDAPPQALACVLAQPAVRVNLNASGAPHLPRSWSLTTAWQRPHRADTDVLFVTANLNADGAQRSLVNLATHLPARQRTAIAVCDVCTQAAFAEALAVAGVRAFRPAATAESFALVDALLAWAGGHGVATLCLWNVAPRVKLLLARFAPSALRLIDVSPGHYAFEELEAQAAWSAALNTTPRDYYARLHALVLKYRDVQAPAHARTQVIPNGVALRPARLELPLYPRFLVSGRIAPSKRLELIIEARATLQAWYPQAQLHIVGVAELRHAAYAQSLAALAGRAGVIFRGAKPALEFLAEGFTAAVVLGTHQGSPNAVLKAMSAGIPVIANASGGTGEIMVHDYSGWLLPEDCGAAQLTQAMQEAITEAPRNRRLAAAGRALVAEHHGMPAMVQRYAELLSPQARRCNPAGQRRSACLVCSRASTQRLKPPALFAACPFTGHEVRLDANTVGVLEQHRVIARRPPRFLRRVHDARANADQKCVQQVDVFARAGAKAEVMQAGAALRETLAAELCGRRRDQDAGAAADPVDAFVAVEHQFHLKVFEQPAIKRPAGRIVIDRQLDVGNAVHFHGAASREIGQRRCSASPLVPSPNPGLSVRSSS